MLLGSGGRVTLEYCVGMSSSPDQPVSVGATSDIVWGGRLGMCMLAMYMYMYKYIYSRM